MSQATSPNHIHGVAAVVVDTQISPPLSSVSSPEYRYIIYDRSRIRCDCRICLYILLTHAGCTRGGGFGGSGKSRSCTLDCVIAIESVSICLLVKGQTNT